MKKSIKILIAVLIIICAVIGAIRSLYKYLSTQKANAAYFKSLNKGYHNNKKYR